MAIPKVTVHGKFLTDGYPSQGTLTFTDNDFYVDSQTGEIATPTVVIAYLDQNGEFWAALQLNVTAASVPAPREWHVKIAVAHHEDEFDFVLSPENLYVEFHTLYPSTIPVLPPQYVSSIAGLYGNITAEQLADQIEELNPGNGESAYELWLEQGNTGTMDDFFAAYEGDMGPVGPSGPQGPPGTPGGPGPMGPVGPKGEPFTVDAAVDTQAHLPVGVGLEPGTVYAVTETSTFHSWTGTEWVEIGTFRGEQGIEGPPGAPGGPPGPQGEKGDQGDRGPQGLTGDTGPQGLKGDIGPTGPQGSTGPQGTTGNEGPQGVQGETGLTGPAGPTGPKGDKGDQGIPGTSGASTLVDLTDVDDPAGPQPGEGPIWVDDHFEFLPSAGASEVAIGAIEPIPMDGLPELWIDEDEIPWTGQTIIQGSLASVAALPVGLLQSDVGKGWIADDTGHLWAWTGVAWTDAGQVRGNAWPDTGWVSVTINPTYAVYGTDTPQVRKIGNICHMRGAFAQTSLIANTTRQPGTLPPGFAPPVTYMFRAGTDTGLAAAALLVNASGQVQIRPNGTLSVYYFINCSWVMD